MSIISNDPIRNSLDLPPWAESTDVNHPGFITKDSGRREEYASGMVRDINGDKPRFDLILPEGIPYEEQFLTRLAALLTRGALKYGERNWEKASGEEEVSRFRASALRHLLQWMCGENDEDHAAAVVFNLLACETTKARQSGRERPILPS